MPQLGVSVAEGTLLEWKKQPGDWVEADETICEISTDKVDSEVPSPASGRVTSILVEPGQTVPVGTVLAELDTGAQAGDPHPAEAARSETRPEPVAAPAHGNGNGEADRSGVYSPVVQRMAAEHHVDLTEVPGSGVGGRVRKKDLVAWLEGHEQKHEPVLHTESPYKPEPEPLKEPTPTAPDPGAPGREAEEATVAGSRVVMSPMRQKIAEHMLHSRATAAHATTIVEADMSAVARKRAELKPAFAERDVPLTYLAFVAAATVEALQQHPILNSSVEGTEIVHHADVNLGIAVALEGGLIVPVIPRAQRLSLEGLAAAIGDLATRAREKRLSPDEVGGGTFTITNPGQFGAVLATPIINQPQVAILDLEAIVKRPVVTTDAAGGDVIAIRPMVNLCMSWDHRALDGAEAARFLSAVKGRLEDWK